MSQQNLEVIRKGGDATNGRDPDGFLACLHPEVVWEEGGDLFPGRRGTYRGHGGARRFEDAFLVVARGGELPSFGMEALPDLLASSPKGSPPNAGQAVVAKRQVFWSGAKPSKPPGYRSRGKWS